MRLGVVPQGTPPPEGVRRLHVLLINPSKYDDEGYVLRFLRGVLPSNTLAALAALTRDVARRRALGEIEAEIHLLDEHVQTIRPERLARRHVGPADRAVVALCGVQTNQFPRAADLARRFRAAGVPVMIGGFHVSGSVAESGGALPLECRDLVVEGITLVKGEVETCWEDLLRDALHGALAPFYDVKERPSLADSPVPEIDHDLMARFAFPRMGTIDAGRGCPYRCSFCTIIAVQGNTMRYRPAALIRERMRANAASGVDYYFFTDDNFARNPAWEEIFDAIVALRRDEGIDVQFMMQVDALAYRIPRFAEKAAAAGCSQVFIGMETLNPANLAAAGKTQNHAGDYRGMIDAWHAHGIACHVGYIIGFPFDTPESVREDVRRLRDEIGVDQASFFMLMPLPGSLDHAELVRRGEWMEPDLNRFDSFHPTTRHPRMSATEWFASFRQAWRDFYTVDAMKAILARANARTYWGLFKNFVWYRYAAFVEDTPPMLCGFVRFKSRRERRLGLPVEPWLRHLRARTLDRVRWARRVAALYFEMQEVWLATRGRVRFEAKVGAWKSALGRANLLAIRETTRRQLDAYWSGTWAAVRRGRLYRVNPLALSWNLLRDARLCLGFNLSMLAGHRR
ncbi:MAG TPA: radical SAM protein [Candidatus Polarisedimenticolaceae bacterium]